MHCQALEQEHVLVRVLVAARAREDGQVPESPVLARQRHGEAAADRRLLALPALELGIGVGHRDRPGEPAVRRAGDRVPLGLLDREAESRDERLSALWLGKHDQGRVGALERAGGLQRPGEHLVQVDRAGELAEDPASPALLLGPLQGTGQLSAELVHPGIQARHYLRDALVGGVVGAPPHHEQGQEQHHEGAQAHTDPDQNRRHRSAAEKPNGANSL